MTAFKVVAKRQAKVQTPAERGMSQIWAFKEDRDKISAACKEIGSTQMQMSSLMRQVLDGLVDVFRMQKIDDTAHRKMFAKAMFASIVSVLPELTGIAQEFYAKLCKDEETRTLSGMANPTYGTAVNMALAAKSKDG